MQYGSIFQAELIAHCPNDVLWLRHFYYIEQYWVKTSYDTRHQLNVQYKQVMKVKSKVTMFQTNDSNELRDDIKELETSMEQGGLRFSRLEQAS